MIKEITTTFLLSGSFFVAIAAVGLIKLPDFFTRMHAATKAGAFGGGLMVIAAALTFQSWAVLLKLLVVLVFFYVSTPVAAQMMGRAAYLRKTPLWRGSRMDELSGHYSLSKGELSSHGPAQGRANK
jgi:multicomponent Na+:H+ antiporter subunit G